MARHTWPLSRAPSEPLGAFPGLRDCGRLTWFSEAELPVLQAPIAADPRHRGMVTIDSGPRVARQFADWSMGSADLGAAAPAAPPGHVPFVDMALTDPAFAQRPNRCRELLQVFRQIE
jgi:hypothetical protein